MIHPFRINGREEEYTDCFWFINRYFLKEDIIDGEVMWKQHMSGRIADIIVVLKMRNGGELSQPMSLRTYNEVFYPSLLAANFDWMRRDDNAKQQRGD